MSDIDDELPRRPRRRPVTPVSVALAAVLIGALGFIGGVEVQKRSAPATAAAAFRGTARQGQGGLAPGGGQAGGATVGQVANVKGSTIYVTVADGNTIRVRTSSNSKVTRTAVSTPGAVHAGDTVIVQGTTGKSGTVTASQIVATARNASGGRAAFGGTGAGRTPSTPGDPTP